jgi:hypothetical protein
MLIGFEPLIFQVASISKLLWQGYCQLNFKEEIEYEIMP